VRCSKGTYIRVLAEDIAATLATIGHLIELRRLSVAPFDAAPMHTLERLEQLDPAQRLQMVLPVDAALEIHPKIALDAAQAADLRLGRTPTLVSQGRGIVRIYGPNAEFLGLGEIQTTGRLLPWRLIAAHSVNRA
jgi:tRNA pseudouridine55 synthase